MPHRERLPAYLLPSDVSYRMLPKTLPAAGSLPRWGVGFVGAVPAESGKLVSRLAASRVGLLRSHLTEIQSELCERHTLAGALSADLEMRVCEARTALYELDLWSNVGELRARRRVALEKQIADLYREQRSAAVSEWQDAAGLKRERRAVEKELRNASLDLWMAQMLGDMSRN